MESSNDESPDARPVHGQDDARPAVEDHPPRVFASALELRLPATAASLHARRQDAARDLFRGAGLRRSDARAAHLRLLSRRPTSRSPRRSWPRGLTQNEADLFQRSLLSDLLARHDIADGQQRERLVTWYFTPMALRFSSHLKPSLCVYDCMDELSQFRGAPQEIRDLERDLISRAACSSRAARASTKRSARCIRTPILSVQHRHEAFRQGARQCRAGAA